MDAPTLNAVMEELVQEGAFDIMAEPQGAPGEQEIAALEERLKVSFPADYRDFMKEFGSFFVQAKETVWKRPEPGQVAAAWRYDYAFTVLGTGHDIPPVLDILKTQEALPSTHSTAISPVLAGS